MIPLIGLVQATMHLTIWGTWRLQRCPSGKVTVFAGESGAGKSYICAGNIVKVPQEQGIL